MKLSRIYLLLLVILFVPSFTFAQKSRSTNVNKSWTKFYTAFQKAVNTRNKVALKKMITPLWIGVDDTFTPADVISNLIPSFWRMIQKSAATGTKSFGQGKRITKDCNYTFQLGTDGQWRWLGVCHECDC